MHSKPKEISLDNVNNSGTTAMPQKISMSTVACAFDLSPASLSSTVSESIGTHTNLAVLGRW